MNDIRYEDVFIDVTKNPTIIIGQNPGNQRKGTFNGKCWHGNRSADLLRSVIDGSENIVLTNACQYREMTDKQAEDGQYDLSVLINELQPFKIICLGNYSFNVVKHLMQNGFIKCKNGTSMSVYRLDHPSYIIRFNKDKPEWEEKLKGVL